MEKKYRQPAQRIKVPRFQESAGFYTTDKRSSAMSKIKAKNTKPELRFRKALWAAGFRYRIHNKRIIGKPDIASQKHKLAIFIDGEFWHGYEWHKKKYAIKSNRAFWIAKIERNMQRDTEVTAQLEAAGYTVLRFWTKDIKHNLGRCIKKVLDIIDRTHR